MNHWPTAKRLVIATTKIKQMSFQLTFEKRGLHLIGTSCAVEVLVQNAHLLFTFSISIYIQQYLHLKTFLYIILYKNGTIQKYVLSLRRKGSFTMINIITRILLACDPQHAFRIAMFYNPITFLFIHFYI